MLRRISLLLSLIAAFAWPAHAAIETSADILSKMSGKDNPQMVLGAYRQPTAALPDASGLVMRDGTATPELERNAAPTISSFEKNPENGKIPQIASQPIIKVR